MSGRFRIIAFVEGSKLDQAFYDGLLRSALSSSSRGHAVITADSLDEEGRGGKPKLLEFYDYLRRHRRLNQRNKSGMVSAAFFVDRDFDPILRVTPRSKHIVRTGLYNIESEVLHNAPLPDALRVAASLPAAEAESLANDLSGWEHDLASAWSEWLHLCVQSVALGSRCNVKPKSMSTIQTGKYGPVDRRKASAARRAVRQTAVCQDAAAIAKTVDAATKKHVQMMGSALTLLNGKHLPPYLEERIRSHPIGARAHVNGFAGAASRCFLSVLNFDADWAVPYRKAILKIAT